MKRQTNKNGFTLVELMVVIGIVAILVALAMPSYSKYIRKANRGEAQQLLMNWANNQEIFRASNTSYDDGTSTAPSHAKYVFSVTRDATTFTLTATAVATDDQANDTEKGTPCDQLRLDQSNTKFPPVCW